MTKFILDDYMKSTGENYWRAKTWFASLTAHTDSFKYGKVINDFISFNDPVLKDLLTEIREFKYIHKQQYFSKRIVFGDIIYDVGSGGLHSYFPKPEIIEPKENEIYEQRDFSGYYPSQRKLIGRPHNVLKPYYNRQDTIVTDSRAEAKRMGNKVKDKTFKLLGNSIFGQFGNEYNNSYCDVEYAAFQTVNGQLMLLMLIEWLVEAGITVKAANTDSVDIIYDKSLKPTVERICSRWTNLTGGIKIDTDSISKAVYSDINCYYHKFTDSTIKEKGRWVTHYNEDGVYAPKMLNKGFSHPVINIALREFFMNNIPVEDTIYNHTDILDFCMAKRANRDYTVYHGNGNSGLTKVQRVNRYYASTKGGYLYKEKNGKYNHMLKGQGVTILNLCEKKELKNYTDLDYRWYIKQCKKQIEDIIPSQLVLF